MNNRVIFENNQIYLSDGIQDFGYLLMLNADLLLVSISENCNKWLGTTPDNCFGIHIWEFVGEYFPDYFQNIHKSIQQVLRDPSERVLMEVQLGADDCYLSIYHFQGFIYLEFELKALDTHVFFPKFELFEKVLSENSGRIWEIVSLQIFKLSGFDRIRVFKFQEDQSGQILAECIDHPELEGILGSYYPNMDIFKHNKDVHLANQYRYTRKIDGETIKILHQGELRPNLSQTTVRMVSPIHAAYLMKDGVNSNFSISLKIKDEVWGYIFCQSKEAKCISLLKREALVYFVQMAVNRFVEEQKQEDRLFYEQTRDFELLLKEKILLKNDFSIVLKELGDRLCHFAGADAMAILSNGDVHLHQISIGKVRIYAIIELIRSLTPDTYFTDHEFILKYGKKLGLDFSRFAGIAYLEIESKTCMKILFFRKEKIFKKKWVEKPVEQMEKQQAHVTYVHEEHPVFDIWHETIRKTSARWSAQDIFFLKRLREIIDITSYHFSDEIGNLKDEVTNLNKALDDYANTVSHDLKNPLSAINLSVQMMLQRPDMPEDLKIKMLHNSKDAVSIINDMLLKIHDFSKVKGFNYQMVPVYANEFIPQIVDFSKLRYDSPLTEIEYGTLFPLYGERTIIYQLFQNLIGNAVKYSAKSALPKVRIYSELDHEFVKYHIVDNGIGMRKVELATVFDSFKRLSNASDFEGTGLGLTIVKRIVDRLNARIHVDSEIGVGTSIELLFPNDI